MGSPLTTGEFIEELRVHPVDGFLFQQRGDAIAVAVFGVVAPSGNHFAESTGYGSNGEPMNPQAMSASERYRASFALNRR